MAELEEIVQKVLLEGDEEVISQLQKIGTEGYESFSKLVEAASKGDAGFGTIVSALAGVATALVAASAAVVAFTATQDDAIQKTNFLADAFGATTLQVAGIEAAFAAAGVSTKTFEQFAQRLTVTIAREWPAITESIRTSSTAQSEAQSAVVSATLRVQEAQNNLADVNERTGLQIRSSAIQVSEAYRTLQFSAQEAAAATVHAFESVASSSLGVEAAEQRLATLEGRPPSEADKKNLEIKQAQLAVDQAIQSRSDARLKSQELQAAAADKQSKLENAAAEAQLKHETDIENALTAQRKAELALVDASNARAKAEENAVQSQLKDIPTIVTALGSVANGQKGIQGAIDLSQVSVQNLVKGFITLSSTGVTPPTGLEVMRTLSAALAADTDHVIDAQTRLAIVQQLSQRGMNATGAAAFELLHVLEQGPEKFEKYSDSVKSAFSNTDEAKENVEKFKQAFENFNLAVETTSRSLAALASPALASFLDVIRESLTSDNGLLHQFVQLIEVIGGAITTLIGLFKDAFDWVDKTFGLEKGTAFKALLLVLLGIVAAFGGAFSAIPAAIALVGLAIVEIIKEFDQLKDGAKKDLDAVAAYFKGPIDKAKELWGWLQKVGIVSPSKPSEANLNGNVGTANQSSSKSQSDFFNNTGQFAPQGHAEGGPISGPGTGTSDSIIARLSHGEFVQKASAVQFWGSDFMHAINNMTFPGFAGGGMIPPVTRLAGTGVNSGGSQSVLNLTIGDRTFAGLRGPHDVIADLSSYAVGRQTTSAGRQPTWVK